MPAKTPIPPALEPSGARKADHLRIAAGGDVVHRRGTGLDTVRLRHRALPGRDLDDVAVAEAFGEWGVGAVDALRGALRAAEGAS